MEKGIIFMEHLYSKLQELGVKVDVVKKSNPTEGQLKDLLKGLQSLPMIISGWFFTVRYTQAAAKG